MNERTKKSKYVRDGLSLVIGLFLVGVGLFGIFDVMNTIDQAEAGDDFILGGIAKSTIFTFTTALFGIRFLIFGHGKPPLRPGETPEHTPIWNLLRIVLLIGSILAGIGLKVWADSRLQALGYVTKPLLDF